MKKGPSTPENHRLYVVGDIHGRADLLLRLLAMIDVNASSHTEKQKKLIFLGDYVDRGLDSRGVIERLCGKFDNNLEPVFIRGNHDDMFLHFLEGDFSTAAAWLQLGGAAALASYGVNAMGACSPEKIEQLHKQLQEKIPTPHREFLDNTVYAVTYGDYYFVHAGVRPNVPLSKQHPNDQMSIRGDFLFSDVSFGKVVVHGHTIRPKPEAKRNRIGIDTGAFATGCLTCLILDAEDKKIIST